MLEVTSSGDTEQTIRNIDQISWRVIGTLQRYPVSFDLRHPIHATIHIHQRYHLRLSGRSIDDIYHVGGKAFLSCKTRIKSMLVEVRRLAIDDNDSAGLLRPELMNICEADR